jgi:hypothetical protein
MLGSFSIFHLVIIKSLYAQWRYFLAKNQYLSYKNFDIVAFWDFEKPNSSPTPLFQAFH